MPHRTPRRQKIARLVHDHGFMSVEELARSLNVTPQTIRRDINVLCEHNILRRYHGGAAPGSSVQNEDYDTRKNKLQSEKAHIADLIAEHIPDNVSLFMSIGTTIEAVALALVKNHKNLCIITNNIHVASIDFINQFKVDYAILGASGIEADGSLLDFDYKEVSVMQAMMANARHCYLAVDHSKFGRNALVRIGDVTEFHALFTDEPPSAGLCKKLDDAGVRWHLAAKEGAE